MVEKSPGKISKILNYQVSYQVRIFVKEEASP